MITHEEYLAYKKLVEDYEQAEYEDGMREAESDLNDDYEDDEFDEDDERLNCTCGAFKLSEKSGQIIHIADCICGAG